MANRKEWVLSAIALALIALIFLSSGMAFGLRVLVEIACFGLIALGLSIQWGYAGLFNAGIMGFIALAGFSTVLLSYPQNAGFWASPLAGELGRVLLTLLVGIGLITVVSRMKRLRRFPASRQTLLLLLVAVVYFGFMHQLDPVASQIEQQFGFVGGFGLPVGLAWLAAGVIAAGLAWLMGKICLGLRSDYLAIATLGIAEIIKAVLKNADWLTRGTLTVSPLPWPVPNAGEVGFIAARGGFLCVLLVLIALAWWLLQRAYASPWGRSIRAIRDNEISAAAMGKDVNGRRLGVFIFGAVLMGIGGAALVSFTSIFDPAGFLPLHHTFLIWVMVILGGAGNNLGTLIGVVIVYVVWVMSEPATLAFFELIRYAGEASFGWQPPQDFDARALQMRVFLIGLTITLVLRFAPNGLLPERVVKTE